MNSLFNIKIPIKKINIELPKNQVYTNLSQEEKDLANSIYKSLNEYLYLWETTTITNNKGNPDSKNNNNNSSSSSPSAALNSESETKEKFKFNLPESNFSNENLKINFTDYTKCRLEYHKTEKSLNNKHLKEILEEGILKVRSNIKDFPYKFKVSKLVITGKNEVFKNFYGDLGAAFDWLYDSKRRLISDKHYYGITLMNGMRNIKSGFIKIADVLVGLKQFDTVQEKDLIRDKELPEKFLQQLKNTYKNSEKKENDASTSVKNNTQNNDDNNNDLYRNNNMNFDLDLSIYSKEFKSKYQS